ncbi:solute carrier family 49 member A3-like [Alosa pseudoharengus]|uniref:solute carrier family 49 member A3-like n=2 Tax=Alosa pseudoharengus TaxID=34774 RepID=UPI003F8BC0BE
MDHDSPAAPGFVSEEVRCEPSPEPNQVLLKLLQFKVYRRRWFILLVLCLLNCSNAMLWLTFAPVADDCAGALGVTLDQINWLSMVYMIVAIPLSCLTTWMLDTCGLRLTLILGSWLNMLGSVLRLIGVLPMDMDPQVRFPLVLTGQLVCAVAQPLVIFSPTKLAAVWFPQQQRATANMIASMSNPLGVLIANIMSPLIMGSSGDLTTLLFVYSVPATVVCFLATVGIRESTPPTPPSASAETSNSEPFLQGIKLLLCNRAYMLLLLCFGSGIGIFTCFSSLLEQMLCVKGYTNDFAGLCGALFILCGVIGAGALGFYVDRTRKFTEVTKINMCLASLGCTAFAVFSQMRGQKVLQAVMCSLFGLFGFSIYPVAMELTVECSYPVGEATSAGLIFIAGQVLSLVYMIILGALTTPLADSPLSVCSEGVTLSWRVPVLVMAGLFCLGACVFVCFFHTEYKRLKAEEDAGGQSRSTHTSTITDTHDTYNTEDLSHTQDTTDKPNLSDTHTPNHSDTLHTTPTTSIALNTSDTLDPPDTIA